MKVRNLPYPFLRGQPLNYSTFKQFVVDKLKHEAGKLNGWNIQGTNMVKLITENE